MEEVGLTGQDTSLPGNPYRLGPGPNSQVPVEILDVEFNGTKAQEQLVGNFLVTGSRGQELEYFQLPFAQARGLVYGHSLQKAIRDHRLQQ